MEDEAEGGDEESIEVRVFTIMELLLIRFDPRILLCMSMDGAKATTFRELLEESECPSPLFFLVPDDLGDKTGFHVFTSMVVERIYVIFATIFLFN